MHKLPAQKKTKNNYYVNPYVKNYNSNKKDGLIPNTDSTYRGLCHVLGSPGRGPDRCRGSLATTPICVCYRLAYPTVAIGPGLVLSTTGSGVYYTHGPPESLVLVI